MRRPLGGVAAFNAVDHQIVDLTALCMQQNGDAISAGIINRVIAGFENRWSVDNGASYRRGNDLQADSATWAAPLNLTGGNNYRTLSHRMAFVGDSDSLRPLIGGVCIELLRAFPPQGMTNCHGPLDPLGNSASGRSDIVKITQAVVCAPMHALRFRREGVQQVGAPSQSHADFPCLSDPSVLQRF